MAGNLIFFLVWPPLFLFQKTDKSVIILNKYRTWSKLKKVEEWINIQGRGIW